MIALWVAWALASEEGGAPPCPGVVAARPVTAAPFGTAPAGGSPCLGVRLDVAGRGSVTVPAVGLSRRLELPRARWELGLWGAGPASGRVAFDAVRSGGGTGYLGIDGESVVPRLQVAEARVDFTRYGIAAAVGMVDDLWVVSSQSAWRLRPVAPVLAEANQWLARSDIGGWVSWTAPRDGLSASVALTTGEGLAVRERNNGTDVAGMLVFRPLAWAGLRPELLELGVYAREGSRGLERARDHRVAARLSTSHRWFGAGVEGVFGWGLDADAERLPAGGSAWVRTGWDVPAVGWARLDWTWADRGVAESGALQWRVGAGPVLPWTGPVRPLWVLVGYEGQRSGADAVAVAGAAAARTSHTLFLQLGVRLDAGLRVDFVTGGLAPPSTDAPVAQRAD